MSILSGSSFFQDSRFPFYMERYTIGAEESVPSHTHDFVELVYVVSGSAIHEMAGQHYRLRPGDVFVVEPDVYHSYTCDGEETVVYNVLFDSALLRKELEVLAQLPSFVNFFYLVPFLRKRASFVPYTRLDNEQRQFLEANLHYIHRELAGRNPGYELLIKIRWIETLVWLGRFHQDNRQPIPPEVSGKAWIDSVRHLLEQHYSQTLSLEQMSRLCGMSVSSFTAKFKEETGSTFLEYKHALQIRHACSRLAATNRTVLDIAHEVGFQDVSFFNKVFRKIIGLTPKQYRKGAGSKAPS